jgi:hypothetical protein
MAAQPGDENILELTEAQKEAFRVRIALTEEQQAQLKSAYGLEAVAIEVDATKGVGSPRIVIKPKDLVYW